MSSNENPEGTIQVEQVQDHSTLKGVVEYETLESILLNMSRDAKLLKSGYTIISQYEKNRNFYLNFLKVIFDSSCGEIVKKLAASTLKIFLTKNWSDDTYISNEERLSVVNILMNNIHIQDYFFKNFIAKLLGIIAAKEFPNCYEGFIKVLLDNLSNSSDVNLIDTYLRILTCILSECDDRAAVITGEILPVIMNVFKCSKENQKNREKCLKIIVQLINKLSYADGTDPELIARNLDKDDLIEQCLSLFSTIIISNPKLLFDIKKYTIRILDILVRDMPIYSSKFYTQLIEPSWRLIVLELSLYSDSIIFNKQIEYEEDEVYQMEDENHNYIRGYESDEEEEKYGIEGLILELVDFSIDLLKRKNVMEGLKGVLLTFLLCIKGYTLLPNQSLALWKDDPNLYITEEFDDENINSVRSKTLNLIKEITKEIDDDSILKFLKIILSEFTEGLKIENYSDVIKLDDYNFMTPYFEKMNNSNEYIFRRHEANLLILGTLAEDLIILREKNRITKSEVEELIKFLFSIISNPTKDNSILVGRAIWCVSRLLSLIKHDTEILNAVFEGISLSLCHQNSDLSVRLVSCLCLTQVCSKINSTDYYHPNIEIIYPKLIQLLQEVSEETILIPIECISALSQINKEKALYVPYQASKLIVEIYSKFYNHPSIGVKILELIKLWCTDNRSAKVLISLFVPFAIFVFDDFFKSLGKVDKNFEEIKKTVITEHGNANMSVKTNLDMLPNLIDIICMLTKYCNETGDKQNLVWISMITNVICEILIKSNDMQILQRGTSYLRFYIPLCKDAIGQYKQQQLLLKVIMRFFDPALLESALLYVGNMIAQYFTHIDTKVDTSILEAIVRRIYKAKMPSIVQSLVVVYSRFLNLFPNDILKFLTTIQVENKVGLKILIDKWLLHQPLFRGTYYKNVSIKALTTLFEIKNEIVETLMVIGYDPSHSNASVEVNAPFKILSVLVRCLNNEFLQEKMKKEKNDYENLDYNEINRNDDDEYERMDAEQGDQYEEDFRDDEGKVDVNLEDFKNMEEEPRDFSSKLNFVNLQGQRGGLGNIETGSEIYLSEMLGFDYNDVEGEDEDNSEEDLYFLKDIEYEFILKEYLYNWFKSFKERDSEYLFECLKCLPRSDQEMFKNFGL